MKAPPWLLPLDQARPLYAKVLEQIRRLEALAKAAGRQLRPKQ
jgi:hypothetical protein